ncbi:gamma carbonic anhydrase family protein [Pseudoclavibacter endophyticus]|uniref:Gamma carbonic anhydrase family protein n=1 Tax=Pseudoclavibacter endophyticus TaxID=1778590 RepID=A0A6H9WBA0_9MICO|nr:gamma carbonic anhydrase family protein [Pseudoclavibacter endophyticus]KAB1647873.1 gamma carbonic anhydrase family protein [Pseudoclavibacter endophyticus]GGA73519.1 gamma carbonic anhydrase family protein [Pseudoclavibacter endophyticus]
MTDHGPLILPFNGIAPRIHPTAWIAPTAVIVGDVEIGPDSSVFYGCVLRADVGPIRVGARTNIQDGSVLHCEDDAPAVLGDDVTLGHQALVHGATIGDGTLIGMKAAVLSRAVVGPGSLIAAGGVVLEGAEIPARSLAAGVPAKVRRELTHEESAAFIPHAGGYVALSKAQAGLEEAVSRSDVAAPREPHGDGE